MTAVALPPFSALVDAHGDELLAHARRLAGSEHAEDVLQEALLRALRAYPRLRHAEHLRAWLHRIVVNCAIDSHRTRGRELPEADPAGRRTDGAGDRATDPEQLDGFEDLIGDLTASARDALRLRFVEDLEYDAIAQRLDCSPEAARQRVSSALRALRGRTFA